jgi:hypothetical protein
VTGISEESSSFLKKKHQKTFVRGHTRPMSKRFLLLFFKKEVLAYFSAELVLVFGVAT